MTQSLGEEENLSGGPQDHLCTSGKAWTWAGRTAVARKKAPSRLPETQENRGTVQERLQLEDLGVPHRSWASSFSSKAPGFGSPPPTSWARCLDVPKLLAGMLSIEQVSPLPGLPLEVVGLWAGPSSFRVSASSFLGWA